MTSSVSFSESFSESELILVSPPVQHSGPAVRDWSDLSEQERHRSEIEQSKTDIAAGR